MRTLGIILAAWIGINVAFLALRVIAVRRRLRPVCHSCEKPVSELFIYTPDGPECAPCTEEGRLALIAELGMTPEQFIEEGLAL